MTGASRFRPHLEALEDRTLLDASPFLGSMRVLAPRPAVGLSLLAADEAVVGRPTRVAVVAVDAANRPTFSYSGTVHFTSSDTEADLPPDTTFRRLDFGVRFFEVTFGTPGDQTLTVTDTATSSLTATATLTVTPAPVATQFRVTLPHDVRAGVPVQAIVTALDAHGERVPEYTGTVHLTSTDSAVTLPADYTFRAEDRGRKVFEVTFGTTGSQSVTATDTQTATLTGSASTNVTPAPVATQLRVTLPREVRAGVPTRAVVTALDAHGHVVPNYTGTVHLTSTDTAATLPADYTFQRADRGRKIFEVTFGTVGSQTLTVTDTQTATVTGSATQTVAPAPVAAGFRILAIPRTVLAGVPFGVVIFVIDAAGRQVPNYTGTVRLTSSDTAATLPAEYTFRPEDRGRHAFSATLTTAGSQTLTVTDTTQGALTGDVTVRVRSLPVAPVAGLATHLNGLLSTLSPHDVDNVFAQMARRGLGGLGRFLRS